MSIAFNARQKIDLAVQDNVDRLPDYLLKQERVVGAMLDSKKLTALGQGSYRYKVTSFKVFQLQVNPVVSIAVVNSEGNKLQMHATDSELDGLGLVDDFELMLDATLIATEQGLVGEAFLGVTYNAAKSIMKSNEVGLINENYNADIVLWNLDDLCEIPYWHDSSSSKISKVFN